MPKSTTEFHDEDHLIEILAQTGMTLEDIGHLIGLCLATIHKRLRATQTNRKPRLPEEKIFANVFLLYCQTKQTESNQSKKIIEACEQWLKVTMAMSMLHGATLAMEYLGITNSPDSIIRTHQNWDDFCRLIAEEKLPTPTSTKAMILAAVEYAAKQGNIDSNPKPATKTAPPPASSQDLKKLQEHFRHTDPSAGNRQQDLGEKRKSVPIGETSLPPATKNALFAAGITTTGILMGMTTDQLKTRRGLSKRARKQALHFQESLLKSEPPASTEKTHQVVFPTTSAIN